MSKRIYRSHGEPRRENLSWKEKWTGSDNGLINCWEIGRESSLKDPDLAERARNGELPVLVWKGGVEKTLKKREKYGTLNYLAQWQGLRGDDLDIDLTEEKELVCSKTEMRITYTSDSSKYADP